MAGIKVRDVSEPVTVPTGLNPGDPYRLAFVTSTTRDATLTASNPYNRFVTGVANSVPKLSALGTTWTAIASTGDGHARDNTGTNPGWGPGVPIYLLNDTLLANGNADLWDGSLQSPLNVTEFGITSTGTDSVWTGTFSDGTANSSSSLGNFFPLSGVTTTQGPAWTQFSTSKSRNMSLRMYAMSDVLTVPTPVPALSPTGLIALGAALVFLASRVRES